MAFHTTRIEDLGVEPRGERVSPAQEVGTR